MYIDMTANPRNGSPWSGSQCLKLQSSRHFNSNCDGTYRHYGPTRARRAARARAGASRRSGLRSAGGTELSDLQTFIQSIERIHVVVVELEIEKLSVRLDAVLRKTLGEDDVSMRQTPLEQNPEAPGCGCRARCKPRGAPRGRRRVRLNLVDGGLDAAVGEQVVELLDVKVGDADGLDLAGVDSLLEGLPGLETLLGAHGAGRVHEVHVHVLDLELLERVLDGGGRPCRGQRPQSLEVMKISERGTLLAWVHSARARPTDSSFM
ncbi:hypothetical protein L1887_50147 [Cichorium endivia]|nr:hypothetical protein L1887_50147 [Cichorium endivia]